MCGFTGYSLQVETSGKQCESLFVPQLENIPEEYNNTGLFSVRKTPKLLIKQSSLTSTPIMISFTYFCRLSLLYLISSILLHKWKFAWGQLHKIIVFCKLKRQFNMFISFKNHLQEKRQPTLITLFYIFPLSSDCLIFNIIISSICTFPSQVSEISKWK